MAANNNGIRNTGVGTPFGSPLGNQNQPHFFPQSKPQELGGAPFPGHGHFQIPNTQSQPTPQPHYGQGRSNIGSQPTRSQFQSPPQNIANLQSPGNTNMGTSSPGFSTPNTGNAKRGLPKPPSRTTGSSGGGANTASPMKTMELAPAAKKKHKLDENQIPEKVAAMLPESALYTQLLAFESRIDAALMSKKISIQQSLKKPSQVQKMLRIYVYNTFANQVEADTETDAEPPSWSLKIIGRILEDGSDPTCSGMPYKTNSLYPKFSSFFKKITVYLDQNLYPDHHVILWENGRSPAAQDGFEVTRKGNKEFTAIIRIEMNYAPEKFKLSAPLVELLGVEVQTRQLVIAGLWHYVKVKKLQVPSDPSYFVCDPLLKKVFGEERIRFNTVHMKIASHLTSPQPIHLEHRIKLFGNCPSGNSCYDVLVDVPICLQKDMVTFLANLEKNEEIDACDDAISAAIKKIHEHRRRRAFFLGFSQSPAEFINGLIASQSKDLKLVANGGNHNAEREQRSEFYNQPWAEDAVIRYLNRKSNAGTGVSGSTKL